MYIQIHKEIIQCKNKKCIIMQKIWWYNAEWSEMKLAMDVLMKPCEGSSAHFIIHELSVVMATKT